MMELMMRLMMRKLIEHSELAAIVKRGHKLTMISITISGVYYRPVKKKSVNCRVY